MPNQFACVGRAVSAVLGIYSHFMQALVMVRMIGLAAQSAAERASCSLLKLVLGSVVGFRLPHGVHAAC